MDQMCLDGDKAWIILDKYLMDPWNFIYGNDATGDEERFKIIHPPKTKMTMEDAKTTI